MKKLLLLALLGACAAPGWAGIYPMEAGSLRRENHSLNASTFSNPVSVKWAKPSCQDIGWPVGGPVLLEDRVIQAYSYGIRCRLRADGSEAWTWNGTGLFEFYNTPTYDPDRNLVYVGATSGDLLALDPATGTVQWRYIPGPPSAYPFQISAPLYAEGKLFVGTGGWGFRCINPDTRDTIWNLDFPPGLPNSNWYHIGTCTPAYDAGRIYLPTSDGWLYCLDSTTGAVVWKISGGTPRYSTVVVDNNCVYNNHISGSVECRRKSDGGLVWVSDQLGESNGDMALCGGILVVPGDSWRVRGLDIHTGRIVWNTLTTGNFARSSPYVVCGHVFISACHGDFYGMNGQTGKIEWRFHHGAELSYVDWAEDNGDLFTSNSAGMMYCFTTVTPGDPAQCVCNLDPNWTPSPSPTPTPTATFTATPTGTVTGSCQGSWCVSGTSGGLRVYFDPANSAPGLDAQSKAWTDPTYLAGMGWVPAQAVTNPPGEWTAPCGTSGMNQGWVAPEGDGLPPSLADAYFRSEFNLPAGAAVTAVSLSLSGDNVVEAWLNGNYLGKFEGPYNGDSWLYTRCVSLTPDPAFLAAGPNVLAFRLVNQSTFHGLTFELCASGTANCFQASPTVTPSYTPTHTPSPTHTPTLTPTWTPTFTPTPTPSFTATSTPSATFTPTSTATFTPTPTPSPTSTPTSTATASWTPTPTPKPHTGPCRPRAYPNPCRDGVVRFEVDGGPYEKVDCKIYTTASRCLHQESRPIQGAQDEIFVWDCKDESGRPVANGVYLACFRIVTPFKTTQQIAKVVVLR